MKPMLAASVSIEQRKDLRFPLIATPKVDGIRCLTISGGILPKGYSCMPVTRSLKDIPNDYIRDLIGKECIAGLDGELVTGTFNDTQSDVMSINGKPEGVKYLLFDAYDFVKTSRPTLYLERLKILRDVMEHLPSWCEFLEYEAIESLSQLDDYYDKQVAAGYEGICLRSPDSPYKYGRSTFREHYLLKIKALETSEALVIGMEELMHNDNPQKLDKLGRNVRSSKQEGMRSSGMMGKLLVRDIHHGWEFAIGTGFDEWQRVAMWKDPGHNPVGMISHYTFQKFGMVDVPRMPVHKGFRNPKDIS